MQLCLVKIWVKLWSVNTYGRFCYQKTENNHQMWYLLWCPHWEWRWFGSIFISRVKQEGGLTIPSSGVVYICKMTERTIREISPNLNFDLNFLLSKNIPLRVALRVGGKDLFSELNEHIFNLPLDNNHINELIKVMAKTYLDIRAHHAAKMLNLKDGASSRSLMSRQIIDNHL